MVRGAGNLYTFASRASEDCQVYSRQQPWLIPLLCMMKSTPTMRRTCYAAANAP